MTMTGFETRLTTTVEKGGNGSSAYLHPPRRVRAVAYVRQGFEEMGKKGTSPEGQKARVAGCADTHEWHLLNTYEDVGWSGEDLDRPGLLALLADLDFLLALLEKRGITCVPATWSWEPLAQYMRWWYRLRASPVYAALESPAVEASPAKARAAASAMEGAS